jgi:glycosyltransferase involved in cell wall biosynthesis
MKVSIISIVFNNKSCITDCIESVLSQSYKNIEHIVIDGGSTDGTQAIIEKYKSKLGFYISEKDNGLYDALNKGILKASGDIIGILHSDDLFFDNNVVKNIVEAFEKTNSDLVYASGQYVLRDDTSIIKRIYKGKKYNKYSLNFGWIPLHTTIYVKSEVFQTFGLYDESYSIASDYEISLRWFKEVKIKKYFLSNFVVKMRLGGKSTTAKLQKKKSSEDLSIIKKNGLLGEITLLFKILRKIPQYLLPKLKKY